MGELRQNDVSILLKNKSKSTSTKIEFFREGQFRTCPYEVFRSSFRYRIRINGRWFPEGKKEFFYPSALRDVVWNMIMDELTERQESNVKNPTIKTDPSNPAESGPSFRGSFSIGERGSLSIGK